MELTPDEIFVSNQLAAHDYYFFARWMMLQRRGYPWQRAPHHRIVCDALMRVFNGQSKRVIFNIPPRYSKTELAVISFIPWCLGKHPDAEFIHTSYSSRLASSNAWQAREIISSNEYRAIFPDTILHDDSQARDEWRTTKGGCVYAVGAGGTITGYGAGKLREGFGGAIIVDDIHKPEDIRHEIQRKNDIEWFPRTLESRKNSANTPIIVIGQRLHEEDLSGWLLAGGNGEKWELVSLPAIQIDPVTQEESALWPEKHLLEELRRMRKAKPYVFSGQYMQSPTPPEGGVFQPDAMPIILTPPPITRWVRAWDLAATEDDGDWTVGVLIGLTEQRNYIIADVRKIQGSPDKVENLIHLTAIYDGKNVEISIPQDPAQAGKAQVVNYTKLLAGWRLHFSPESGDKVTRAEPLAAQVNTGLVSLVKAPWNAELIHEMRNFPFGKHDDHIDAAARAFNRVLDAKPRLVINNEMIMRAKIPMTTFRPRARLS